jgi:hypothetical protein
MSRYVGQPRPGQHAFKSDWRLGAPSPPGRSPSGAGSLHSKDLPPLPWILRYVSKIRLTGGVRAPMHQHMVRIGNERYAVAGGPGQRTR